MKTHQTIAGVLLIALLVAAALLTVGARISEMIDPVVQEIVMAEGEVQTGQLPSAGAFQIDVAPIGTVELEWADTGEFSEDLTKPTAEELAELPDLGTIELSFLLQKGSGTAVTGFVEIDASIAFTGYHTIDTTLLEKPTTMTVGPAVSGNYANGILNLQSERVPYVTTAGEAVERQFRLVGSQGQTPGVLIGEYRETVWGYGLEPLTIVGTFELTDLSITLAAVNRPPVVDSLGLTTPFNTPIAVSLIAGDPEQSPITYVIVAQPGQGTLSGSAPNLTYTPNAGFAGMDTFTFKVNDGALDSETESVTIRVLAASGDNNVPTANAQTVNAITAQGKSIALTGSDPDSNPLTFVIVTQPGSGTLSGTAPNVTYTSNGGFVGTDTFTFKVNDGTVDSPAATVTVNVTAPTGGGNTAPTATAQSVATAVGQAVAITLVGADVDNNTLTYIIVSQPTNGTLSGTAPNLTYTPNPGFEGVDSFSYKVNDGTVDSETVTVSIEVEAQGPVDEGNKIFLPKTQK